MPPISLNLPFERCFVLNYGGHSANWDRFARENGWSDRAERLIRVRAIDPVRVRPPRYWTGTPRQWSRSRALTALFETCLDQRIASAMVIDDTARLVPHGGELFQNFVNHLPTDWRLLILGGRHQHLGAGLPLAENPHVYRPYSVAAPIAFLWRGFPELRRMYDFCLRNAHAGYAPREYGEQRRLISHGIYAPSKWIFSPGPEDKVSSLGGTSLGAAELNAQGTAKTIVAVLACYRGGSSCVAGVLHHLGVSMGERFLKTDRWNPRGYFECQRLHRLSRRFLDHPSLALKMPPPQIVALLKRWGHLRARENPNAASLGAKHPCLSCLGPELSAAWPKRRLVVVERQPEAVINSICRTGWGWSREEATIAIDSLLERRQQFLTTCPPEDYCHVAFEELLREPRRTIRNLVDFLELPASATQLAAAQAHVQSAS